MQVKIDYAFVDFIQKLKNIDLDLIVRVFEDGYIKLLIDWF